VDCLPGACNGCSRLLQAQHGVAPVSPSHSRVRGGAHERQLCGRTGRAPQGWKRCHCVIRSTGAPPGARLGTTRERTFWRSKPPGSWDGTIAPVVQEPVPMSAQSPPRVAIADAIPGFLGTRKATVAYSSYRKYLTFTNQLQTWSCQSDSHTWWRSAIDPSSKDRPRLIA